MNTVQLECFVTVAEHLNFSKASRELKITQPAVSHQIQALEEELEVKLFTRTSKAVSLTPEGILFLGDAQLILRTAHSAKERLGKHEHFTSLELGCHNYLELNIFPPVLNELFAEFPLLRPNFHLVPFPSLLGMVENDQVHAALGMREEERKTPLRFKELCLAPIVCICSPRHPLAAFPSLAAEQLSGNFVACSPRQIPDSVFALQNSILINLPAEQRFLAESVESVFALVKSRIGYTLYPDIVPARDPSLCYIPVSDLPSVPFGVYYQYSNDRPILKRFLTLLAEYVKRSASQGKE